MNLIREEGIYYPRIRMNKISHPVSVSSKPENRKNVRITSLTLKKNEKPLIQNEFSYFRKTSDVTKTL